MDKSIKEKLLAKVKSPQFYGFFISVIILAVISVIFFFPADLEGLSLRQADMQQGAANGQEALVYEQQSGEKALWTNSLFGGMPTFQISPEYESNSLFNWINQVYGLGLPSPANLLFMMMFGFLILLFTMKMRWYYALLGAIAWGFSSYFIIIIGAGHIWKFMALTYVPPTIAGVLLCYHKRYVIGAAFTSLFAMMQLNANHPQMTYYFGLLIFAIAIAYLVEAIRKHELKRWLIGSVCILLAGGLAIGANAPSLYNTYEYSKETKRSQSELTPIADTDNGEEAEKPRPTGGMPYEQIVGWSYGGAESFSLLIPDIKGGASAKPIAGQMTAKSLAELDGAKEYSNSSAANILPYFSQYFNDSEGTNGPVYVGAIILVLFLMGCVVVKGPLKWALCVMTLISVLLALGYNFSSLTDFMIYNFPLYNKFRAVESILVIAEFCIPLLAVLCLWQLYKEKNSWHLHKTAFWVCFGIGTAICLFTLAFPGAFGDAITTKDQYISSQLQNQVAMLVSQQPGVTQADIDHAIYAFSLDNPANIEALESLRYGMVRSDALRSLLFLLAGGACLFWFMHTQRRRWLPITCLTALVLFDLYGVDKRYVSEESFCDADLSGAPSFSPDEIDRAILADTTLSYRVLDIPGFDLPDRSYFHKMVGGYHAAKLNRYEDLIQRRLRPLLAHGYHTEVRELNDSVLSLYSPEDSAYLRELKADYGVLDMLNTKYIITGDKDNPLILNTHALGNAWFADTVLYVNGADAEIKALDQIDFRTQAVADSKFKDILGHEAVASAPGDSLYLVSYTPNTLKYKSVTKSPAIGVFSEVYFPWGWKASIDGEPAQLARVNYLLRAIAVPAGEHEIVMTFDPDSIHVSTTIAYICVTFIYMLLALGIFCEIKRKFL